jgi:hypothetical protein
MDTTNVREARRITRIGESRAFTTCLKHSRFSVITLLIGLGLMLSDQGRDLLIAYADDGKTVRLAFAAAVWALSIWFWCRVLLDIEYDDKPDCLRCYNRWRSWMPRVLGSLAFAAVAFSALQENLWALASWTVGALVVFLISVITRRDLSNQLALRLQRSRHEKVNRLSPIFSVQRIGAESKPPYATLRQALGIPGHGLWWKSSWEFQGLVALAMIITFSLLCLGGYVAPVALGKKSGAMILFFFWAATWLPIGSWMSYTADKEGWPLLTILAVIALASSFFNDNHEIRHADGGMTVASRPSVNDALQAWAKVNSASTTVDQPFVVVATAGGGIRAAYWTGTVLGALDGKTSGFRDHLFSVSGVSGGSVGATVYRALIALPPNQLSEKCPSGVMACAQKILGAESLGPLAAAMLYPDLAQRFWPFPMLPDRAAALEKAWENAFNDITGENGLNSSLAELSQRRAWPALFLNATWSDTGRRIVASNLRYADAPSPEATAFIRSKDQLSILGYDLRLSTAAHNSARFPYVSPPGMWRGKDGEIAGRLQDGGLFENYGAETALEILDFACHTFECAQALQDRSGGRASQDRPRIYPVVILITSDPSLPSNLAEIPPAHPIHFGYEVFSTLLSYEHVRGGRGAEAAIRLKEWTASNHGKFFSFRMCDGNAKDPQPPLGWALSSAAQKTISSYLLGPMPGDSAPTCFAENAEAVREIGTLLSGRKPLPAGEQTQR